VVTSDIFCCSQENYRVIKFWRHCRGTKVKSSMGKNDKFQDLIPEGKHRIRYRSRLYNFTLAISLSISVTKR
jgi:hypothetical protein